MALAKTGGSAAPQCLTLFRGLKAKLVDTINHSHKVMAIYVIAYADVDLQ